MLETLRSEYTAASNEVHRLQTELEYAKATERAAKSKLDMYQCSLEAGEAIATARAALIDSGVPEGMADAMITKQCEEAIKLVQPRR